MTINAPVYCPGFRKLKNVFASEFDNVEIKYGINYLVNSEKTTAVRVIAILLYRQLFGSRDTMVIDYKLETTRNYALLIDQYEDFDRVATVLRNLKINFRVVNGRVIKVPSVNSQTAVLIGKVLRPSLASVTIII